MDKTIKSGFDSSDCRVLDEFVRSLHIKWGSALLRSRLKRQEFPWTSFKSETATHVNKVWQKWVFTVLFEEDGDFVRRLKIAGVAEAIHTSADVVVLLQLPVFGSVDLTLLRPNSNMLKPARHLQTSLSDAGRYAKELSKSRRVKKSSSKDEHPKTRRSSKGKEVVGDKKDSKKKKITILRKPLLLLIG
ncbi:hypothetical protein AHAS_Ahas11G0093900 [Arachis hypogaea]